MKRSSTDKGQVKLVSVKPTVFFVRKDNVLTQLGEATVNNLSQEQVTIVLQSQISGRGTREISATIPKGQTTVRFPFADVNKPTLVNFILKVEGKERDRHSMTLQPQRKWSVYFIPITH
ncbi:MAG: hypothetical protein ACYSWW_19660, partial [Planctomycetota bacterium]